MLDGMRKNARSWGIKILFGIIVLVFVFWGVGGFKGERQAVLATVDGRQIQTKDFMRAYDRQLRRLRDRRPDIDTQTLKKMNFKQQLFNQMVEQQLLLDKAKGFGLVVPATELRQTIQNMKMFQNEAEEFDPRRYTSILRANNLSPGEFESDLGNDVLVQKMINLVTSPVQATAEEARDLFEYVRQQATIDYIRYPIEDFRDEVQVSQEEIKAFYEEHQDRYREKARIKIAYIPVTPQGLAPAQEVDPSEVQAFYARNKDSYTRPEQVKVRHIVIRPEANATAESGEQARERLLDLKKRLDQGASFQALAKEHSQGPSAQDGGNLGWVKRGDTVKPFEKAAFSLEPGEVSQPVQTQFGWHLITVEDKKAEGTQPLEAVRDEIRQRLARNKAADSLDARLDVALEALFSSQDLEKAAEQLGIEVQQSELFTKSSGLSGYSLDQAQIDRLFRLKEGEITESPLLLDEGYLLAQKIAAEPSQVRPLSEVRDAIERTLRRQKALDLAKEKAQADLQAIQGKDGMPQELASELKKSDSFNRQGSISGLGRNAALAQEVFSRDAGDWLAKPYEVGSGYVLARVAERMPPEEKDWQERKDFWISRLNETRKQALLSDFVASLRSKAEIEIQAPDVLSY